MMCSIVVCWTMSRRALTTEGSESTKYTTEHLCNALACEKESAGLDLFTQSTQSFLFSVIKDILCSRNESFYEVFSSL